jgi:hypothetical protein
MSQQEPVLFVQGPGFAFRVKELEAVRPCGNYTLIRLQGGTELHVKCPPAAFGRLMDCQESSSSTTTPSSQ